MDKKRIGIYYNSTDSWIGGKYYLDGIISVLRKNPNTEIIFLKRSFYSRLIGKIFGKKSSLYTRLYYKKNKQLKLDVVFPYINDCYSGKKNIAWVPDFQENYYPCFFSVEEICARLNIQTAIAYSKNNLILSSNSSKQDFTRLFPKYTCNLDVLSFVSSLYGSKIRENDEILRKYVIKEPFFICSNQLWKHKNHIAVIKAIDNLKKQKKHVLCIFTGKEEDYREPTYPDYLKEYVKKLNLDNEIRFLGFIPREDQINLMKKSIAVIQPSLFEGWNTSIEDAKVFNKLVIASSLPVHKEQLKDKGIFFEVDDIQSLSVILEKTYNDKMKIVDYDYQTQVKEFEEKLEKIFL